MDVEYAFAPRATIARRGALGLLRASASDPCSIRGRAAIAVALAATLVFARARASATGAVRAVVVTPAVALSVARIRCGTVGLSRIAARAPFGRVLGDALAVRVADMLSETRLVRLCVADVSLIHRPIGWVDPYIAYLARVGAVAKTVLVTYVVDVALINLAAPLAQPRIIIAKSPTEARGTVAFVNALGFAVRTNIVGDGKTVVTTARLSNA